MQHRKKRLQKIIITIFILTFLTNLIAPILVSDYFYVRASVVDGKYTEEYEKLKKAQEGEYAGSIYEGENGELGSVIKTGETNGIANLEYEYYEKDGTKHTVTYKTGDQLYYEYQNNKKWWEIWKVNPYTLGDMSWYMDPNDSDYDNARTMRNPAGTSTGMIPSKYLSTDPAAILGVSLAELFNLTDKKTGNMNGELAPNTGTEDDPVPTNDNSEEDEDEDDYGLGGVLLRPFMDFIVSIADTVINALQITLMEPEKLDESNAFSIAKYLVRSGEKKPDPYNGGAGEGGTTLNVDTTKFEYGWLNLKKKFYYVNAKYSPEEIFSNTSENNNIPAFNINFFSDSENSEDGSSLNLRPSIAGWFVALRNFSIAGLLLILLYIGIRIVLSSTSADKSKYKQLLKDWLVALLLLFTMHYIMAFTITVVESIVNGISPRAASSVTITGEGINENYTTNLIGAARFQTQYKNIGRRIPYVIMYVALVIYTVMFTLYYFKRVFMMAFLTMIAPLVALTYPIDKITDNKAQAFDAWLKEYVYNALLQPFHLIIYIIFVSNALNFAKTNVFYMIASLWFVLKAESILRGFFGFNKAKGGTMGALGTVGLATMLGNIARGGPKLRKSANDSGKEISGDSSIRFSEGTDLSQLVSGAQPSQGANVPENTRTRMAPSTQLDETFNNETEASGTIAELASLGMGAALGAQGTRTTSQTRGGNSYTIGENEADTYIPDEANAETDVTSEADTETMPNTEQTTRPEEAGTNVEGTTTTVDEMNPSVVGRAQVDGMNHSVAGETQVDGMNPSATEEAQEDEIDNIPENLPNAQRISNQPGNTLTQTNGNNNPSAEEGRWDKFKEGATRLARYHIPSRRRLAGKAGRAIKGAAKLYAGTVLKAGFGTLAGAVAIASGGDLGAAIAATSAGIGLGERVGKGLSNTGSRIYTGARNIRDTEVDIFNGNNNMRNKAAANRKMYDTDDYYNYVRNSMMKNGKIPTGQEVEERLEQYRPFFERGFNVKEAEKAMKVADAMGISGPENNRNYTRAAVMLAAGNEREITKALLNKEADKKQYMANFRAELANSGMNLTKDQIEDTTNDEFSFMERYYGVEDHQEKAAREAAEEAAEAEIIRQQEAEAREQELQDMQLQAAMIAAALRGETFDVSEFQKSQANGTKQTSDAEQVSGAEQASGAEQQPTTETEITPEQSQGKASDTKMRTEEGQKPIDETTKQTEELDEGKTQGTAKQAESIDESRTEETTKRKHSKGRSTYVTPQSSSETNNSEIQQDGSKERVENISQIRVNAETIMGAQTAQERIRDEATNVSRNQQPQASGMSQITTDELVKQVKVQEQTGARNMNQSSKTVQKGDRKTAQNQGEKTESDPEKARTPKADKKGQTEPRDKATKRNTSSTENQDKKSEISSNRTETLKAKGDSEKGETQKTDRKEQSKPSGTEQKESEELEDEVKEKRGHSKGRSLYITQPSSFGTEKTETQQNGSEERVEPIRVKETPIVEQAAQERIREEATNASRNKQPQASGMSQITTDELATQAKAQERTGARNMTQSSQSTQKSDSKTAERDSSKARPQEPAKEKRSEPEDREKAQDTRTVEAKTEKEERSSEKARPQEPAKEERSEPEGREKAQDTRTTKAQVKKEERGSEKDKQQKTDNKEQSKPNDTEQKQLEQEESEDLKAKEKKERHQRRNDRKSPLDIARDNLGLQPDNTEIPSSDFDGRTEEPINEIKTKEINTQELQRKYQEEHRTNMNNNNPINQDET